MENQQDLVNKAKHSVKGKVLMVSFILLALLVLNVSSSIIIQYLYTEKNMNSVLSESLESAETIINSGFDNLIMLINDHAHDYEFVSGTSDQKAEHCAALAMYDETVNQLVYVDEAGNSYGTLPDAIKTELASASVAATTPDSENSTFWVAVKTETGSILASEVSVAKLSGILDSIPDNVYLLNSNGTVFASSIKSETTGTVPFKDYVQNPGGKLINIRPTGTSGNLRCYASCGISNSDDWTLLVSVKSTEYYSGIIVALVLNIVLIVIMTILGVIANLFIVRNIITPLDNIRKKITDISFGNLNSADLKINSDDELGVLASSVNEMAEYNRRIISDIQYTAEEIAKENLCVKPQAQYNGDYIPVKIALESIVDSMKDVVVSIDAAGKELSSGSAQMSANSALLNQAASEESDTVNELNDSLNQIHKQISSSAEKASIAREMTETEVKAINEGNEKMVRMLAAMEEINSTSSEIANIIKTIQDISFQTNILSLNASIEAARAGAAGKGFAVVAGEVGNLANKTAEAAKSTTGLIETSVKAVENGTVIANETAQMLEMIVGKAAETANVVNEIADAAVEEAKSVQFVLDGMNRISVAVNQVSNAAHECANSSETLAEQSSMLRETVDKFVIDGNSKPKASKPVQKTATPNDNIPVSQAEAKPVTPAAKPVQKSAPKTITMPDDEPKEEPKAAPAPKAEVKPAPRAEAKPAAPKPAPKPVKTISLPDDKPKSKPVISLPDDEEEAVISSASTSKPVSKATMQPIKYTVKLDPNKY